MLRKALDSFGNWQIRRLISRNVITTIEGVPVISFRDDPADFLRVITVSFDLLREHDPRRLRKIASAADWVVDTALPLGARSGEFRRKLSAIFMDFELSADFGDDVRHAAYFAALLVHEGTHGALHKRGFNYTKESRVQHERICVMEGNRFLARMNTVREGLGDSLQSEFDAGDWEEAWAMSRWESARRTFKRMFEKNKSEPDEPPKPRS